MSSPGAANSEPSPSTSGRSDSKSPNPEPIPSTSGTKPSSAPSTSQTTLPKSVDIIEQGVNYANQNTKFPIDEEDDMDDDGPIVGAPTRDDERDTTRNVVTLKLKSISLPYFNGDLTEWGSFKDFFEYCNV